MKFEMQSFIPSTCPFIFIPLTKHPQVVSWIPFSKAEGESCLVMLYSVFIAGAKCGNEPCLSFQISPQV